MHAFQCRSQASPVCVHNNVRRVLLWMQIEDKNKGGMGTRLHAFIGTLASNTSAPELQLQSNIRQYSKINYSRRKSPLTHTATKKFYLSHLQYSQRLHAAFDHNCIAWISADTCTCIKSSSLRTLNASNTCMFVGLLAITCKISALLKPRYHCNFEAAIRTGTWQ